MDPREFSKVLEDARDRGCLKRNTACLDFWNISINLKCENLVDREWRVCAVRGSPKLKEDSQSAWNNHGCIGIDCPLRLTTNVVMM
jgi:hypothetical protein